MKGKRIGILLLCLLLAGAALAEASPERVVYADQGGARVFAEGGKAGLMDSEGNVLLPAEYDAIEPFGDSDFAGLHRVDEREGGRVGVVRRDGTVAVPCEWEVAEIYAGVGLAECWNDFGDQHIYDLETGEEWKALGANVAFDADDRYIYILRYGEAGFGYEPPFHTDVYGSDRALLFSADAFFVRGFGPDYAILEYNDGSYGVMDASGRTILDGLCEPPWMDGHGWVYQEPRSGNIHYVRAVKNPLNRWLKPLKLDRRHARFYLSRLGIDPDGAKAESALKIYDDGRLCGVADPEGNALFEIPGVAVYGPDDAGLYRVQTCGYSGIIESTDRWGFVDETGETVIEPKYRQAYPFVDGAAVVLEGGKWHLIDPAGEPVGDAEWDWNPDSWTAAGLQLPVIPVQAEGGYRIIDRRGNLVTDEVFRDATSTFGDRLMLMDGSGNLCLMDGTGNVTLRVPGEEWIYYGDDGERIWIMRDGLWGLMDAAGDHPGEWLISPEYAGMDRLDSGYFLLKRPDGTAVYADGNGTALGPAPAYPQDEGW